MTSSPRALLAALLLLLPTAPAVLVAASAAPAGAAPASVAGRAWDAPPEDYAAYDPQRRCRREALPGTVELARWFARQGGRLGGLVRGCRVGGTSEHKDGRAFDWHVDARVRADRRLVADVLDRLTAPDRAGNEDALARRMGVMYVIWDDRLWSAWDGFEPEPYLSGSCRRVTRCSPTLRHRDHVHVSLSRAGARGLTSWYAR